MVEPGALVARRPPPHGPTDRGSCARTRPPTGGAATAPGSARPPRWSRRPASIARVGIVQQRMHLRGVRPQRQQRRRSGSLPAPPPWPRHSSPSSMWRGQGWHGSAGAARMMSLTALHRAAASAMAASQATTGAGMASPSTSTSARCTQAGSQRRQPGRRAAIRRRRCRGTAPCSRIASAQPPTTSPSASGAASQGSASPSPATRGTCWRTGRTAAAPPRATMPAASVSPSARWRSQQAADIGEVLPALELRRAADALEDRRLGQRVQRQVQQRRRRSPPAPPSPKAKAATPDWPMVENGEEPLHVAPPPQAERGQQHAAPAPAP